MTILANHVKSQILKNVFPVKLVLFWIYLVVLAAVHALMEQQLILLLKLANHAIQIAPPVQKTRTGIIV